MKHELQYSDYQCTYQNLPHYGCHLSTTYGDDLCKYSWSVPVYVNMFFFLDFGVVCASGVSFRYSHVGEN